MKPRRLAEAQNQFDVACGKLPHALEGVVHPGGVILALPQLVEGKDVDVRDAKLDHVRNVLLDVFATVGKARDYRHAADYPGAKAHGLAKVLVAHLGIDSRNPHATRPVRNLEVDEKEATSRDEILRMRKGDGKRCLDCRVHAMPLTAPEKLLGELLVHEALTAGKRHPSPGLLKEHAIAQALIRKVLGAALDTQQLLGTRGALLGALGTYLTGEPPVTHGAPDAQALVPDLLGLCREVLRIAAPRATEGAALHKGHGAYPSPIVQGKALDVGDGRGCHVLLAYLQHVLGAIDDVVLDRF